MAALGGVTSLMSMGVRVSSSRARRGNGGSKNEKCRNRVCSHGHAAQDLVEAGSTATGERLVLLILFLRKNGSYDIV